MNKTIFQILEDKFKTAFVTAKIPVEHPILLTASTKEEFGDYQINGVMTAAKKLKINPKELAQRVIDNISLDDKIISKLEIAGPGFININLFDNFLSNFVINLSSKNKFGVELYGALLTPQTVVVDYSSPNLAKEMHVGHLRSTVIGDALCNIFAYLGHKVIKQNHVGDFGTQFGMIIAFMLEDNSTATPTYQLNDLEEFYRLAKVRFDTDDAFKEKAKQYVVILQNWQTAGDIGRQIHTEWEKFTQVSLNHCKEVYQLLNVGLSDTDIAPESKYHNMLDMVVKVLTTKGLIRESDGAKCVFFENNELKGSESSPFIVQKNDGGYLYATTDLAALDYRAHVLNGDRLVYVVDNRQSLHFEQLFAVAKKADFAEPNTKLEHISFGTMMNNDGKPFKTRTGGTVKLIDFIKEAINRALVIIQEKSHITDEFEQVKLAQNIAIASIKYIDLSKNRTSDYVFSFDQMLSFEGNTAPYLLYAYTRIQSILKKVPTTHKEYQDSKIIITKDIERKLILLITKFVDTIIKVDETCYSHLLCQYLYNICTNFMQFYETCPIITEENEDLMKSKLALTYKVSTLLHTGLGLLGITTVDTM